MTPANRIKLEKAGRELTTLSRSQEDAQSLTLAILRTQELLHHVLVDLAFRPEVNTPKGGAR